MTEQRKIPEGPPLFIESLLGPVEYTKASKLFPNTWKSSIYRGIQDFKEGEFKCRWRMGGNLTLEEIIIINKRIQEYEEIFNKGDK